MRVLAFLLFALFSASALANCDRPDFIDPSRVRLTGNAVMIVTHASSMYDARLSTKRGLDEATRYAKQKRIPLVYLQDDSPAEYYFMQDCYPDYRVLSIDGDVRFDLEPAHVYVAGGHLEMCLSNTLHDVLSSWAKRPARNLTITYLMDAIYSNGKSIEESDPFYRDFQNFMSVVTHGRPGGEHWPKLTLLETLGIIVRDEDEYDYLRRVLPRYDRTLPADYRVELQINDAQARVVRPARDRQAPTLRFHFVDSALALMTNEVFRASAD
jgi:hypothetical protein